MRKLLTIIFVLLLSSFAYADLSTVDIIADGELIDTYDQEQGFDVPAVIYNSRSMLPLKKTFALFGIRSEQIYWHPEDRSISVTTNENNEIWLQIDNPVFKLNGVAYENDVAPMIYKNRTFLPLGAISKLLGVTALWDGDTRSVILDLDTYSISEYGIEFTLGRDQGFSQAFKDEDAYYLSQLAYIDSNRLIRIKLREGTMSQVLLSISKEYQISSEDLTMFDQGYYQNGGRSCLFVIEVKQKVFEIEMTYVDFEWALELVQTVRGIE